MTKETKIMSLNFKMFDPQKDSKNSLPDTPGNYILVLRETAKLPDTEITPIYETYKGYNVVYTGTTSNLRSRYKEHFEDNNAGWSTLRKSLGCLRKFQQIPRDKDNPENEKTKFNDKDEEFLSNWMQENLLLYYSPETESMDKKTLENLLIKEFYPPLNIQKNRKGKNRAFVAMLDFLRNNK